MVMIVTAMVGGLGSLVLLLARVRWSLLSLWPAAVATIGLWISPPYDAPAVSPVAYAVIPGMSLYITLLLSWVVLAPTLRRNYNLRF